MIFDVRNPSDIKLLKRGFDTGGGSVGITSGCFDMPHWYHLYYLKLVHGL